jgi:hypothetical protein
MPHTAQWTTGLAHSPRAGLSRLTVTQFHSFLLLLRQGEAPIMITLKWNVPCFSHIACQIIIPFLEFQIDLLSWICINSETEATNTFKKL